MHCYDSEMLLAMTHDDHSYSKSEFEAHMVAQKIIKMKEEGYIPSPWLAEPLYAKSLSEIEPLL
jgi:hypothetical protein